jgi:hypothetical protein
MLDWSLLMGLLGSGLPDRLHRGWRSIAAAVPVEENRIVQELKRGADETGWIFVERPINAFHAKRPVPPALAVMPSKRFWSGQISLPEIERLLREYRPEKIYLQREDWRKALAEFLEEDYLPTRTSGVFVRKDLPQSISSPTD